MKFSYNNEKLIIVFIIISFFFEKHSSLSIDGNTLDHDIVSNIHPHENDHPGHHDSPNHPKESKKNIIIKGTGAIIMFCFSLFFGILPKLLILVPKIWISLVNVCQYLLLLIFIFQKPWFIEFSFYNN